MAGETVSVRISLHDAITAGLVTIEHQAKETRDALSNMEDKKLSDSLDGTTKKVQIQEKGLRRLRMGAMDLGFAFKMLKVPALAVAITQATSAISSMTAGVVALTGAMAPAVGIIGAAPAGLMALVSSLVVTKMAMKGVGDAVKVMNKPGATVAEVAEAMKGLSPPAQAFAKQVSGLQPHLKKMRESFAAAMLPRFGNALRTIVPLFGDMQKGLTPLAGTIGKIAERGAKMLASGPFRADFKTLMGANNVVVERLGGVLVNVMDIIRNVMIAAQPLVDRMSKAFLAWSERLKLSAQRGRDLGTLTSFFTRAWETAARLGRTLKNFAMGLFQIFKVGRGLGDDMADSLEGLSKKFRSWTESASGQNKITGWFDAARPVLSELGALVRDVAKAFGFLDGKGREAGGGITETIRAVRTQLLPALTALMGGVGGQLGPALVGLATGVAKLLNFASFSPLIEFVKALAWLINTMLDIGGAVPGLNQAVTAFIALAAVLKLLALRKVVREMLGVKSQMGQMVVMVQRFTQAMIYSEATSTSKAAKLGGAFRSAALWVRKFWMETVVANVKLGLLKLRMLAVQALDFARFILDIARAYVKQAIAQGRILVQYLLMRARMIAYNAVMLIVRGATLAWAAAQWLLNAAMYANPIGLVVIAIAALVAGLVWAYHNVDWFRSIVDTCWQAIQTAWDFMLKWGKWLLVFVPGGPFILLLMHLPQILGRIRDAFGWVSDRVRGLVGWFQRAAEWAGNLIERIGNIPGLRQIAGVVGFLNPFGDTARPRGRNGNLARTFGAHAAISARTPGTQQVTNVTYGAYRGSDHLAGRAMDLVGSGLQTYAKQVKAIGGYAAMHGSGDQRHLHAVYGDTARPRGGSGAAGAVMVLEGPLIGTVYAKEEVDVDRAVKRALDNWLRDRNERK